MKLTSHDIIRKPVITEKSMAANKVQIKRAVEEVFNVKVADVKTMRFEGKTKRVGVHIGKRADFKKAVITLAEGSSIEFFEGMQ